MKKILGFLTIAALLVIGCTPKDDYQPAERESGAQYYFPLGTETNYTIAEDVTGYDFTIMRVVKDDAADIIIEVKDTSKTIFPEGTGDLTASFAAGDGEATISLPVDYSKYEFGDKIGLDLTIANETTLYAPSSIHIELLLPEPWVSLGKGTWVSKWLFEDTFEDVEFFQNQVQPNHFRFAYAQAIVDAYEDEKFEDWPEFFEFWILKPGDTVLGVNITMEDLVTWSPLFNTGMYVSNYDDYICACYPAVFTSLSAESYLVNSKVALYQEDGLPAVVQLAPSYYMLNTGGWASMWASPSVTLVFPGVVLADYSVDIEYTGLFNYKDQITYAYADVTLGDDVEYAKVAIVPGNDSAALNGAIDLILSDEESDYVTEIKMSDTKPVTVEEEEEEGEEGEEEEEEEPKVLHVGEIRLPLPEELNEYYSFVVVPFGGGKAQLDDAVYTTFQYKDYNPWEDLGYILYTDDLIGPLFGLTRESYWVPFQKSLVNDGVYRLVNPYHEAFPYNAPGDWNGNIDHNIIIDASDPDVVVIPMQYTGTNWGYGEMFVVSLGQYYIENGYSVAEIIAGAGDIFGKLADGKITFAAKTLMVGDDDDVYVPRDSQGLVLDLNDIREVAPASAPLKFMPKKSARDNAKASFMSMDKLQKTNASAVVAKGRVNVVSKDSKPVFTGRK